MNKLAKIAIGTSALLIVLVIGLVIGLGISSNSDAKTAQASQKTATVKANPPTRAELLKLVNAERAKYHVAPLKIDSRLNTSAQEKADSMVKNNNYGHMLNGVFIGQQFINKTGITCQLDDENLHEGTNFYATAKGAVAGWIGSRPHFTAMVNKAYTRTGFGFEYDPNNSEEVFVEHFCTSN